MTEFYLGLHFCARCHQIANIKCHSTISLLWYIIHHCHGNGLFIGGEYLRCTHDHLMGSRIYDGFMNICAKG